MVIDDSCFSSLSLSCFGRSYEESYFGRNLGLEASGVVRKVGRDVESSGLLKVGDRVICGEKRCFTSRLNAKARYVRHLPPQLTMEDGASLRSAYNTAHCKL